MTRKEAEALPHRIICSASIVVKSQQRWSLALGALTLVMLRGLAGVRFSYLKASTATFRVQHRGQTVGDSVGCVIELHLTPRRACR